MITYESTSTILLNQNLADYIEWSINQIKENPCLKLEPVFVQVVGEDVVSDGNINFQCVFSRHVEKGAYLRLIDWSVDLENYKLNLKEFQSLGGEGYTVQSGRLWDTEKLRDLNNSKLASSEYVILRNPVKQFQEVTLPPLNKNSLPKKQKNHLLKTGVQGTFSQGINPTLSLNPPQKTKISQSESLKKQRPLAPTLPGSMEKEACKEVEKIKEEETIKFEMKDIRKFLSQAKHD